ncbi:MAG: hypothetical protein V7646_6077 [Pseudonocardia sp.]
MIGLELLKGEDRGLEVLGDTAYGTGDARAAIIEAGHTAIIKPAPLRPAVDGGFTTDDFTVDEAAGTATCPKPCHPADHGRPGGHLRCRLPRLPAAGQVHHQQDRPHPEPAPPRRRTTPSPPHLADDERVLPVPDRPCSADS